MRIGFIGLGKMGSQMVTRLLQGGHEVVVTDLDTTAVAAATQAGAIAATDRTELVQQLGEQAIIWLMIPAQYVDSELQTLLEIVPAGTIIIDGGNSDFRLTRGRAELCKQAGATLVDVGTSGGVLGLTEGFSMMVGGNPEAYKTIEPFIKSLARPEGYNYFGPSGAGHYVKMIHNAIEYGLMEAYAEGYRMLKDHSGYPGLNLAAVANVWQHGSIISSELNGLTVEIFSKNPELSGIEGYVAESGEARWTLEVAATQNIPLPAIQTALNVRIASEKGEVNFGTKLLAAMRNAFGGHKVNK